MLGLKLTHGSKRVHRYKRNPLSGRRLERVYNNLEEIMLSSSKVKKQDSSISGIQQGSHLSTQLDIGLRNIGRMIPINNVNSLVPETGMPDCVVLYLVLFNVGHYLNVLLKNISKNNLMELFLFFWHVEYYIYNMLYN